MKNLTRFYQQTQALSEKLHNFPTLKNIVPLNLPGVSSERSDFPGIFSRNCNCRKNLFPHQSTIPTNPWFCYCNYQRVATPRDLMYMDEGYTPPKEELDNFFQKVSHFSYPIYSQDQHEKFGSGLLMKQ